MNSIEKTIEIRASQSRVWQALTDHRQFGAWFGVKLDGPFMPGSETSGRMTIKGFEHLSFWADVTKIEPERYFAFKWHPYPIDPDTDYSVETPTLVEFTLAPIAGGTRLHVIESGFDAIPEARRAEAFMKNEAGWGWQLGNIRDYAEGRHAA